MALSIATISIPIGVIAGIIYYVDGWGPTPGQRDLSQSKRYQGLGIIVSGGVISPVLDKYFFDSDRFEFFQGYLLGVAIGWALLFVSTLVLFVVWKNTKELQKQSVLFTSGQIAFSILEVISFGISDNPPLQREQDRQSSVDALKTEFEVSNLREKLKKENPERYIEFEEQNILREQGSIERQLLELNELRGSLERTTDQPKREAEDLLHFKKSLIDTLKDELELARASYEEDNKRSEQVVAQYQRELARQEALREELASSLKKFEARGLSKMDFARLVSYEKITQYETGGETLGAFTVRDATIKIYQGDITNLIVDAVVSSDDNYLTMGGGVSMRIANRGGPSIRTEASKLVPLKHGDVAETTAGDLHAQRVFHGVTIDFDTGKGPSEEIIRQIVRRCVQLANKHKFRSIAFPLLGTGVGGFAGAVALEIMLSELIDAMSITEYTLNEAVVTVHGLVARTLDVKAVIERVRQEY